MTVNELRQLIFTLNIGQNTRLIFTFLENGNEVVYGGIIEFYDDGLPGINNGRVGVKIRRIKEAEDIPYPGGLNIADITDIRLDNE